MGTNGLIFKSKAENIAMKIVCRNVHDIADKDTSYVTRKYLEFYFSHSFEEAKTTTTKVNNQITYQTDHKLTSFLDNMCLVNLKLFSLKVLEKLLSPNYMFYACVNVHLQRQVIVLQLQKVSK